MTDGPSWALEFTVKDNENSSVVVPEGIVPVPVAVPAWMMTTPDKPVGKVTIGVPSTENIEPIWAAELTVNLFGS